MVIFLGLNEQMHGRTEIIVLDTCVTNAYFLPFWCPFDRKDIPKPQHVHQ